MLRKSLLVAVFSGLTLFSVSGLSGNVEKISSAQGSAYTNKVALLDVVKSETAQLFESPSEIVKQKNQLQDRDNELVSTATGFVLLVFGVTGFVMRASRAQI